MQNPYLKCFLQNCKSNRGFSLIELMVVLVIVGILAIGVVFMFADPTAKVKAAAFEMRGDFNLARAEAVKENADVLISFDGVGYRIWIDDWDAGGGGGPGSDDFYTDGSDTLVKEVVFKNKVKYYEIGANPPANGPEDDPLGNALDGEGGITLGATTLTFKSNGTCDNSAPLVNSGSVVVYYPKDGDPATSIVKGRPYAIVVDSMSSSCNARLARWRPEKDDWDRK